MKIKGLVLLLGLMFPLTGMNLSYAPVSAYSEAKIVNPGATYETQRVWLTNFVDTSNYKPVVSYDDVTIDMVSVTNSKDSKVYYYADIPYKKTSVTFRKTSISDESSYTEIVVPTLAYGVCYYLNPENNGKVTPVVVDSADINLLALVVESYLTYGKDDSNGTTNFTVKSLFNTWFRNKSASKEDMKNVKIWDYTGYAANGNKYDGLVKNAQFSVNEKWNTMCSQAGIDPNTGLDRNNFLEWIKEHKSLVIALGVGIVVVIGGATILIIHKKKKETK